MTDTAADVRGVWVGSAGAPVQGREAGALRSTQCRARLLGANHGSNLKRSVTLGKLLHLPGPQTVPSIDCED